MPELPEVETVCRTLQLLLNGKTITHVTVNTPRIVRQELMIFKKELQQQTIQSINRRGKYILFLLSNCYLVVHLRMEGKFLIKKSNQPIEKHEHVIFHLDHQEEVRYHDTRKFGTMEIVPTTDLNRLFEHPPLKKLGQEVWDDRFDDALVKKKIQASSRPIKSILLDQEILCGIGNIYADEICHVASILPTIKGNELKEEQIDQLIHGTKIVFEKAISLGGTTIHSFQSSGVSGKFQNELRVHRQTTCSSCNTTITKLRIGGRTTYYCTSCQHN